MVDLGDFPDTSGLVTDDDPRTHRERRDAGDPFWGPAPEFMADQQRAQELLAAYGPALERSFDEGVAVLKDLLGHLGEESFLVPGFQVTYGYHLSVGGGSFINSGCIFVDDAPITIGENTLLAPRVQVITGSHPMDHMERRRRITTSAPVTIGDDCWIGAGAIVLPGVTIGDRSVIGAGAVVTRDVPADSVAVGNPARVIRTLD